MKDVTSPMLERIANRWTVAVVIALELRGVLRYLEIRATAEGISQRQLTAALRTLERDGFVRRTRYVQFPPRVDYELTRLGRGLAVELRSMREWLRRAAA